MKHNNFENMTKPELIAAIKILSSDQNEKNKKIPAIRKWNELKEKELFNLAAVEESTYDAVVGTTLEGIIISWNVGAERIYGYKESEILGRTISIICPPEKKDELFQVLKKIRNGQNVEPFETIRLRKDKSEVEVFITISPVKNEHGIIIGAANSARDISQRKGMERVLKERHEKLHLLSELTSAIIGKKNIETLAYQMVEQVKKAFDVDACVIRLIEGNQLILLASAGIDKRVLHPRLSIKGLSEQILKSGRPVSIPEAKHHPITARFLNKKNEYIFSSYAGAPLLINERVLGIIGIYTQKHVRYFSESDLEYLQTVANHIAIAIENTRLFNNAELQKQKLLNEVNQRKNVEEELKSTNILFRTIFASLDEAVLVVDEATNKIIGSNPVSEEIFNYSQEEIIDKKIDFLFYDRQKFKIFTEEALLELNENGAYKREIQLKKKNGNPFYAEVTLREIAYDENKRSGLILVARDITERKITEKELQDSEARYRELVELSPDAIGIHYRGKLLFINSAGAKLFGRGEPKELIGRKLQEVIHPDSRKEFRKRISDLEKGKTASHTELKIIRPDGSIMIVESVAIPFKFEEKNAVQFISHDVTERKKFEQERENLLASTKKYAAELDAVFESLPDGIYIGNINGILKANSLALNLFGFNSIEELDNEIFSKNEGLSVLSLKTNKFINPKQRAFFRALKGESLSEEIIIQKNKSNEEIILRCAAAPIYLEGEIIGAIVISTNITEKVLAENSLKESEQKYRSLINQAGDAILLTDKSGNILLVNNKACELLGYKYDELLKLNVKETYPEGQKEKVKDILKANYEKRSVLFEREMIRKDGSSFMAEISIRVLDEGNFQAIIRNISERKKAEENLRQSELKHRTLFETMIQGVVYQNPDGKIIAANPAAEKILGVSLEQMQGKKSISDDGKAIYEDGTFFEDDKHPAIIALELGREVKNVVMGVMNPKTNEHKWININSVPIFHPGEDRPFQVDTTFEDITKRKKMELALRESEEKYRLLIELSPDAVGVYTNGIIVFINSAGLQLLGAEKPNQVIGKRLEEFIHPESAGLINERFISLSKGMEVPTTELKLVRIDGSTILVESSATEVNYNNLKSVQFVLHDITERIKTFEELNSTKVMLESTFEGLADAIFVIEPGNRTILTCNSAVQTVFGYSEDEVIGRTTEFLHIDKEHFIEFASESDPILEKYGIFKTEFIMKHKNGKIINTENTVTLIKDDKGEWKNAISVVRDISEKKQIEKEREKLFKEINEARERLKKLSRRLLHVQETERRHIARELHDEIGQSLTAVKINLQSAINFKDHSKFKERLKDDIELVEFTLNQVPQSFFKPAAFNAR